MQYVVTEGAQGICPIGWHIPTDAQWYALEIFLAIPAEDPAQQGCSPTRDAVACYPAGVKLAIGGDSGFNGIYTGFWSALNIPTPIFTYRTTKTYFWNSKEVDATHAVQRNLASGGFLNYVGRYTSNYKSNGISVRCLKD
jgi:uncharacterized protein (TIGR02145 family)